MIELSYILTTYNKLEYLKVTLPNLIKNCLSNEEIIIFDGGSTDGTAQYLQDLYTSKQIHFFISEKDKGEAHGYNKAFLQAKGTLIKIITDDDYFDYNVIQHFKYYMLDNTNVDVVAYDGLGVNLNNNNGFSSTNFVVDYINWKQTKTPFLFCGLALILRKNSLALLGLFNTKMKIVDWEYALRITSLPINFKWFNKFGYVNIANASSNSNKFNLNVVTERDAIERFYLNKTKLISRTKKHKLINTYSNLKRLIYKPTLISKNYVEVYNNCDIIISEKNKSINSEFL
jgi:glycosyltransferase involved in cell wall biosynthesis